MTCTFFVSGFYCMPCTTYTLSYSYGILYTPCAFCPTPSFTNQIYGKPLIHPHNYNFNNDNGYTLSWMWYPFINMLQKAMLGQQEGFKQRRTELVNIYVKVTFTYAPSFLHGRLINYAWGQLHVTLFTITGYWLSLKMGFN